MPSNVGTSKSSRPQIAVVGSLITDLVVQVDRAPEQGETVIGHSFGRYAGGKGANQAVAAARLGATSILIGRVGNDFFGQEQLASLNQAGVDISHITRDDSAPSGVANIIVDAAGRNRIAIAPGANNSITIADLEAVRRQIATSQFLMVQLELQLEITLHAMEIACQTGIPIILNPAPARPIDTAVLHQVALLTPNEVEAAQLTGLPVRNITEAVAAAHLLISMGPTAVVITLGEQGALVVETKPDGHIQETHIPPHQVSVVDTVAAGDAFNGALAVRLASGDSLVEAAHYANAVAAISITRHGAQPAMPTSSEVADFLHKTAGKSS